MALGLDVGVCDGFTMFHSFGGVPAFMSTRGWVPPVQTPYPELSGPGSARSLNLWPHPRRFDQEWAKTEGDLRRHSAACGAGHEHVTSSSSLVHRDRSYIPIFL